MNLRVADTCEVYGPGGQTLTGGAVFPSSAVPGGQPEVDRLVRLGAVAVTPFGVTLAIPPAVPPAPLQDFT